MAFLNLTPTLETIFGIIILVGIISLIYTLLDRHEKLKTLAGIVWVVGCVIIFALVLSAFYWTVK